MDPQDILLEFFKALGQKERLIIMGLLTQQRMTVPELAAASGLKEMSLLRHLSLLEYSGLVAGDETHYWADIAYLEQLNRDLWSTMTANQPKKEGDEAILARFVRDGRLVKFPTKESHRLLMLNWVLTRIDPEKIYSEGEISDLLAEINEDYASLRRYLVDYGLMMREGGRYWRIQ